MMLVGDVANRTAILIDDLADTSNTITRAAKLLKKEGATRVVALLTHGILSGDAIERINASALDQVVVTNSVPQEQHKQRCPKLEVLEIGHIFAEVRRFALKMIHKLGLPQTHANALSRRSDECITARASACYFNTTESNLSQISKVLFLLLFGIFGFFRVGIIRRCGFFFF